MNTALNTDTDHQSWALDNQAFLVSRWRAVQRAIESENEQIDFSESDLLAESMSRPPALVSLATIFSLSDFEQFIVLVCAGVELDGALARTIRKTPFSRPCFELMLGLFTNGHLSAITPAGPLRDWRIIELEKNETLISCPLCLDERILHYLSGISYGDARLKGLVKPCSPSTALAPSLSSCAEQLVAQWTIKERSNQPLLVQLCGQRTADVKQVAKRAIESLSLMPCILYAQDIPKEQTEREALSVLWQREALLDSSALIIVATRETQERVTRLVKSILTPCVVLSREPIEFGNRSVGRIDVPVSSSAEQLGLWRALLSDAAQNMDGLLSKIVSQFSFSAEEINDLSQHALASDESDFATPLWQQCRSTSRKRLENLAERIDSDHQWGDLVLPEAQKQTLYELAAYARQRHRVYSDWQLGAKSKRGQGGSCLFHGPSGTGKTMAASVVANELQLDLYRIDLSQLVNKYIGETEKNIARVFDVAENSGAILLFDEADSLFAKRTEVKTSNDRNANMGTSYLLQRMESYSGIAILTTNLKKEIDNAFMRRIRFATQFPFPDQATRQRIWEKVFPPEVPVAQIDFVKLASLDIAGGNIRNVAINAAFYAAEENGSLSMAHLAKAARREYSKLEKPIRESDLRGWA